MNLPAQDGRAAARAENANGAAAPADAGPGEQAGIVLDASGGDAPLAERLTGALEAAALYPDVHLSLCGIEAEMEAELGRIGSCPANVSLVHAPDMIGMHESPVRALREKKNSSIGVGIAMVADGRADAFVSAGNTGAVAAASTLKLGRLRGVQRPGIAAAMKVFDHDVVAIDVGANVDCKPMHLLQYGIMATVFSREVLNVENPRVGLLNVGEESAKGNELVKRAFELLSTADLNFVGNIEPESICDDSCDIVVCDGFVGNVMLKLGESLTMKLIGWLRQEVRASLRYKMGFLLCKSLFRHLKECADYTEYGGAPLLGIKGVTIITHGTSDANAIRNAIREARMFVEHHVNEHMEEAIQTDVAARQTEA
jgi:glycerol-3-phosphate acyltransferase PlsX